MRRAQGRMTIFWTTAESPTTTLELQPLSIHSPTKSASYDLGNGLETQNTNELMQIVG